MVEPWNNLPETVMQSKTLNTFKNRLDQFWSNQAILYYIILSAISNRPYS